MRRPGSKYDIQEIRQEKAQERKESVHRNGLQPLLLSTLCPIGIPKVDACSFLRAICSGAFSSPDSSAAPKLPGSLPVYLFPPWPPHIAQSHTYMPCLLSILCSCCSLCWECRAFSNPSTNKVASVQNTEPQFEGVYIDILLNRHFPLISCNS